MKIAHFVRVYFAWLALFNWPPLLMLVPYLGFIGFMPVLFWINIPALWFGFAESLGKSHFNIEAFGAEPKTSVAWLSLFMFWNLLAAVMTGLTAIFPGLLYRNERIVNASNGNHEGLAGPEEPLRQ